MEQDITQRLKDLINYLKITPSKLADDISINRSRLSHILNGRNNPTLEVIQGFLIKYQEINPDWLLFGNGTMLRQGTESDPKDLFQFAEINTAKKEVNIKVLKTDSDITKTDVIGNQNESRSENIKIRKDRIEKGSINRITVYFNTGEYQDFKSE